MRYGKLLASVCCSLLSTSLFATNIDQIIAFGDSLSDTANLFNWSVRIHAVFPKVPIMPKNPPYSNGRFTNGPNYIDNLGAALNVPVYDYAYGGSWAEPYKDSNWTIPFSLGLQVDMYLLSAAFDHQKDKHLFIIWTGSNDYTINRDDPEYATTNAIATIKSEIEWLIYYGAKNILVINVADLGRVPEVMAKGPEYAQATTHLCQLHDSKFAAMMIELKTRYPDATLITGDALNIFNAMLDDPQKYGFKNATEACYRGGYWFREQQQIMKDPGIIAAKEANFDIISSPSLLEAYKTAKSAEEGEQPCANPQDYVFWDHIHPTTQVHQIIAKHILNLLAENNIHGKSAEMNRR